MEQFRHIAESAMQVAGQSGLQGMVLMFGPNAGQAQVPAPEMDTPKWDQEVVALRSQLEAANTALAQERENLTRAQEQATQAQQAAQDHMAAAQQAREAGGAAPDPAQAQALAAAQARVSELEQALASAQQAPPAPGEGPQPEAVQEFDSFGVEHLGLDDGLLKLVRKHYETIGALRKDYEGLDSPEKVKAFVGRTKLKKDYMVSLGIALLGKAPSSAPRPSSGAPAAPAGGGAPDVPEGHADRAWIARLDAARAREARMNEEQAKLTSLRQKATAAHAEAMTQDEGEAAPTLKLHLLPEAVRTEIQVVENTYNVIRGQMIACCWSCNLAPPQEDSPVSTIWESLKASGLGALMTAEEKAAEAAKAPAAVGAA